MKKITTVEEYIASQPTKIKATLKQVGQAIRKAAPDAEETISYQMPAYKLNGMLLWFSAHTNHYGVYPMAKTIQVFKDKLKSYELSKGTIRFLYDQPVPVKLISEIVKYRVKDNQDKALLKKAAKKKSKKTG